MAKTLPMGDMFKSMSMKPQPQMNEQEKSRILITANEVREMIAGTERRIKESEAKLSMAEHYIEMEEKEFLDDNRSDGSHSFQVLKTNQSGKSKNEINRLKLNLKHTS